MSSTSWPSFRRAAGLLAILVAAPGAARAADPRQRVLIVDLTTAADKDSAPTVISVDADQLLCSAGTPPQTLQQRLADACGNNPAQADVEAALEASSCLRPGSGAPRS